MAPAAAGHVNAVINKYLKIDFIQEKGLLGFILQV